MPPSVVPSTKLAKLICPDDSNELSDAISTNIFMRFVLTDTEDPVPFSLLNWVEDATALAH